MNQSTAQLKPVNAGSPLTLLANKIKDRQAVVSVIGLGYVGLPLACAFAKAGFRVMGIVILFGRVYCM